MWSYFSRKYNKIKSSGIKVLLGAIGLSTVCFIFEACYGTPMNLPDLAKKKVILEGNVYSSDDNKAIESIQISAKTEYSENEIQSFTGSNGSFSIEMEVSENENITLTARDVDGNQNGEFMDEQFQRSFSESEYPDHLLMINIQLDIK